MWPLEFKKWNPTFLYLRLHSWRCNIPSCWKPWTSDCPLQGGVSLPFHFSKKFVQCFRLHYQNFLKIIYMLSPLWRTKGLRSIDFQHTSKGHSFIMIVYLVWLEFMKSVYVLIKAILHSEDCGAPIALIDPVYFRSFFFFFFQRPIVFVWFKITS